jgi:hypothetical protein
MSAEWDHPTLTQEEFIARAKQWATETDSPAGSLWWLSFASDKGFLGACVVPAPNMPTAITVATIMGINPGGEVMVYGPLEDPPEDLPIGRLMSKEEIENG